MENTDKFPFFPRNTKNEVPLNWTPTKMRGKPEYRCNYYQYNFKYGEIRRCSHCCRKQYIINHKDNHAFTIPQEEDDEFDKKVLEKYHKVTYTSFNQRYVKHLGAFCVKVDLSCQKGSSEALRTFSINCIQLGADISSQLRTNSISVNQILNPVSVKTVKNAILNAASDEFEQKVTYFQKYKYLSLLCDAGTVVKLHCLHFILVRYNEQIDKLILETFDVQCGDSFFIWIALLMIFRSVKITIYLFAQLHLINYQLKF